MNNGSLAYQKGDLITIKQSSMICAVSGDSTRYSTVKKPTNAIFLSYAEHVTEDRTLFDYLSRYTPIGKACKIAIGNEIWYVDAKNFFFHIQRHEEVR